jgi:DNA repair ATPase RecN
MFMENNLNNADAPVTEAGLKAEFVKFEEKMEQLLSEQANVILEAVGETMEKKLDEKFDPVITKLDGIMKGVEALQQENTVGAEQLRRHKDQLQKHEARIAKLETAPAYLFFLYARP